MPEFDPTLNERAFLLLWSVVILGLVAITIALWCFRMWRRSLERGKSRWRTDMRDDPWAEAGRRLKSDEVDRGERH